MKIKHQSNTHQFGLTHLSCLVILAALLLHFPGAYQAHAQDPQDDPPVRYSFGERLLVIEDGTLTVTLDAATLETTLTHKTKPDEVITLSEAVFERETFDIDPETRSIRYPNDDLTIAVRLEQGMFKLTATTATPQHFTWPVIPMLRKQTALIWPQREGSYIPLDDEIWHTYLLTSQWNTIQRLSMPFWGIETGERLLSYLLENPFHNTIRFRSDGSLTCLTLRHQFPNNADLTQPLAVRIFLDYGQSPITPAKHFRALLKEQNLLVTLEAKMAVAPGIKRLIGAPHAYLHDGAPVTIEDFREGQVLPLLETIVRQTRETQPTPGARIKQLLSAHPDIQWTQVEEAASGLGPEGLELRRNLAGILSELLRSPDFYAEDVWPLDSLPSTMRAIAGALAANTGAVVPADLLRLNSYLLYDSFADYLHEPSTWGNGVSTRMLDMLAERGFDRFLLCFDGDSWDEIDSRPHIAISAKEHGYLFGTYDSYHSVQDPDNSSWHTAHFDRKLFEEGQIYRANGDLIAGFLGIGIYVNPLAIRPYMEERVTRNFSKVPYSYYFLDCDAVGEFFDNYGPHKVSQREDAAERVDRMRWVFETFRVPVGSEGGSYLFAPVLTVAEGISGPLMGHGDPDMENAASPYWVGRHTPADEPPIFFKRVPLKERYAYLIFDPRFRLPLYETALHDSVLATTHYARASLKFTNVAETMALTEMLYQVAPMYHLNVRTLESIMPEILPHIEAFEKTHTYSYQYALEDFAFLTPERDVQRTRFGSLELIANFRATEVDVLGRRLPARSVVVTFTESGESFVYRNEALADHSGTRSVADLRRVLSDSDWQARKQAAEELALRGPEAVDALFDLIVVLEGDEEWQVRNAAISALAALGREAEPAVPALIGALEDEEWQVRKLAAYALAALGEQARPAIPQLIAALQDEEWQVCEPAALALGAIGADAKDAVPALQACLDDEEWRVSKAAKDALKKFGVRIEEGEQNMLDGHQGSMGPETTVRELVAFLGDSEWKIRKSAAIALTARGSEAEPAIPALIEALSDEEWQVRKPAAQALAAIGPASQPAIPQLIEALKDEEWQVREPAALALGVIGPGAKDAVPALQACLDDEERQVSKAAKDALEKISGTPSVLTTYVRWVALLVAILIVALLGRRLIYKP